MECTTYPVPCLSQTEHHVNGNFSKLKMLSDTPVGCHTAMAYNSNYVAAVDSNCWLSSENSPYQTMCAHVEEELLQMIAANRNFVAKIA